MSGYGDFAYYYNQLMADADYDKRVEYLWEIFRRWGEVPTLLLDLACGTGSIGGRFWKQGVDVIGVDCSEDMLAVARENYPEMLLLCQDATELDLYGTVDGAICCLDSLNHIVGYDNFCRAIERTALFLEPGKLFIFDVNTPYKHHHVLGNNTIIKEYEHLFCVWQNSTDSSGLTHIDLDIFEEDENEAWVRTHEDITEQAYSAEQIAKAAENAGLEILAMLGDMSFDKPDEKAERIIYVCKRIEK